ncbi:MAG TPA: MoaD/ThiS family protein [Nitrososphaerales archaeon]|nr:MoaD/ThiS family protein [Nitrososphaerales archaeon]HUK74185.1 MoaD/ThiS family protein [Nitrososphaerales archaeon]
MPVKVHVTSALVRHLNASPELEFQAASLGELLDEADRQVDGFRDSICDEAGNVRVYVNIFVNGENIVGGHDPLSAPLRDGDEIYILANVAGGKR